MNKHGIKALSSFHISINFAFLAFFIKRGNADIGELFVELLVVFLIVYISSFRIELFRNMISKSSLLRGAKLGLILGVLTLCYISISYVKYKETGFRDLFILILSSLWFATNLWLLFKWKRGRSL